MDRLNAAKRQLEQVKREQREAAAARKAQDRRLGFSTTPTYVYNRKLNGFVERPVHVPPRSQTTLRINGIDYTWPALAGESSGRAIREAAEVWRQAKEFYGLADREAEEFARRKIFDGVNFQGFQAYARSRAERGLSLESSAQAWRGAAIPLPPSWRRALTARPSARERGEEDRIAAIGTGRVVARQARPERSRPPKPRFEGDFVLRIPWREQTPFAAQAEPAPFAEQAEPAPFAEQPHPPPTVYRGRVPPPPEPEPQIFQLPPKKARKREPSHPGSGAFGLTERELAHLDPHIAETMLSYPGTPGTRGFSPAARSIGGSTVISAVASPTRTPGSASPAPGSIITPTQRIRTARESTWIFGFPDQARGQTGRWRFRGGQKIPHLEIVKAGAYDSKPITIRDEEVLAFLFDNGYTPKTVADFVPIKSGGSRNATTGEDPKYSIDADRAPLPLSKMIRFISELRPLTAQESQRVQSVQKGKPSYWKIRLLTFPELHALEQYFGRPALDPDNWRTPALVEPRSIPGFPR